MTLGYLSLMAGLANGYEQGSERAAERARRDKLDQIVLDRDAREKAEWAQQQADRAELRSAAEPQAPQPDMAQTPDGPMQRMVKAPGQDNADVGMPGEPAPTPAYRVGMQGMLNQQQAQQAAASANTPDAVRARQLAVLAKQSPERAAALQAHDTQMKATQLDLANKQFDSDLNAAAARGFDALVDFTNQSPGTTMQARAVPSPDGKTVQIHKVLPDGTLQPTGLAFSNDTKGALEAANLLSKQVPIQTKLKHYVDTEKESRLNKLTDAQIDYYKARGDAAQTNANTKAAGGSGRKADHFDEKEWDNAAKIEPSFVTFDNPDGGKGVESPELRLTYRSELNSARGRGDMSPSEAAEAARTTTLALKNKAMERVAAAREADPKSKLTEAQAVRDILKEYQAAQTKPKPASASVPAGAAPAAVSPTAAAAQVPAPAAGAGRGSVNPSMPAAAEPMGFMQRLVELGKDYESPEGKAALKARVQESKRGGPPLNEVEAMRAKQLGLDGPTLSDLIVAR